jgi:hypothetical protein
MMLLFLIMRCTPTIRELIAAIPLSLSSQRLPASRFLLPRSELERSDFVPWHEPDHQAGLMISVDRSGPDLRRMCQTRRDCEGFRMPAA